jgi:hypothetical protein
LEEHYFRPQLIVVGTIVGVAALDSCTMDFATAVEAALLLYYNLLIFIFKRTASTHIFKENEVLGTKMLMR